MRRSVRQEDHENPQRGVDWRIVISGANFVALLGLLFTALGSWNTVVTGIAKTDVVVLGIQRQMDRMDTTTSTAARDLGTWQQDTSKRLIVLESELKNITAAVRANNKGQ